MALKSFSLARLHQLLQVVRLRASLRIFWNQAVPLQVVMLAQVRLRTIPTSQMQISRPRLMSMVIRKLLMLRTIRLRTSSPSRRLLGNGFISLTMLKMPFWFKAVLIASPRSTMVARPSFHSRHLRKKAVAKTSLF